MSRTSAQRVVSRAATGAKQASAVVRSDAKTISLADAAYERIKHDVISLRHQPGSYLNEAQICNDLRLGRTPVHHAVMRLALEGLLEVMPRKGILIRPLSLQELLAVIEVRLINESACVRLAAERGTEEEFEALASCLKRGERMIPSRDVTGLMNVDREFHSGLAKAAHNPLIEQFLQRLHEQSLRFWFVSLSDPGHLKAVDAQHWAIVAALMNRDADRAEEALRHHIQSFRDHIRQVV